MWLSLFSKRRDRAMNEYSYTRCTRQLFDVLFIAEFFATIIFATQPLLSGKAGYDTILVRGFNLMEFSVLGCVPVLAPILLIFVVLGCQERKVKELCVIAMLLLTVICYSHGFIAAQEWLLEASEASITYHPCILFFPMSILLEGVTWLTKILCLDRYDSITCITLLVPWNWGR